MATEHTKGLISKLRGWFEAAVGRLTGNRRAQARGKVRQVQGELQEGLGDVQDAAHRTRRDAAR